MQRRPTFSLTRNIFYQHSLRELRTKPSHCHNHKSLDDDDQRNQNIKENQELPIYFYKSKGQHILTNPRILDSIVRRSNIQPTDTVLEIGPGTGNLTLKLLEVAKKVVAIEIDKRMVEVLNKRVAERELQDKITVLCKDALKTEFPPFDLVVANIPYNISSPLVTKLVYGATPFGSATLLLQKEFARRLLANPGDSEFSRLAVNVKLVAEVEFVMDVSKRDFLPCPKVDSSVVIIRPKAIIPDVNLDEWWAFTRTCFSKKNRTLGATFKHKKKVLELFELLKVKSSNMGNDDDETEERVRNKDCILSSSSLDVETSLFKEKIIEVLKSGGFEDKRPLKLSIEQLLKLLSRFNQAGIYFINDHTKLRNADRQCRINFLHAGFPIHCSVPLHSHGYNWMDCHNN
ncbi:RrnaAD domain-containing protein [Cephalotus follicularis]|uniref:rRNA adenine N(6)-methyltransferase n=1 Tax=Cephalotus follicularis TaxID=3775 RepID=A0A1Q3BWD5_CEPFO|nr:RrnaAD domain-containing protein [Cephalotus follicularis]